MKLIEKLKWILKIGWTCYESDYSYDSSSDSPKLRYRELWENEATGETRVVQRGEPVREN